jgi:predicted phosphoribosyltransferase
LERRERLYRGALPPAVVEGRTVILVDDGLATGATMRAAVKALKRRRPAQIVVAVPVAARETCEEFRRSGDALCVCAETPTPFDWVGRWYTDFSQTTDEEVSALLARAGQWGARLVA